MKYEITSFNTTNNTCTVTIECNLGKFTGTAKCHPNDEFSSYFGLDLAEGRAVIKMWEYRKKIIKEDLKILNNVLNDLEDKYSRKIIKGKIKTKKLELKSINCKINNFNDTIKHFIFTRSVFEKRYLKDKRE